MWGKCVLRGGGDVAVGADVDAAAVASGAGSRRGSEPDVRMQTGSGPANGWRSLRSSGRRLSRWSRRSPPWIAAYFEGGSGYMAWLGGRGAGISKLVSWLKLIRFPLLMFVLLLLYFSKPILWWFLFIYLHLLWFFLEVSCLFANELSKTRRKERERVGIWKNGSKERRREYYLSRRTLFLAGQLLRKNQ